MSNQEKTPVPWANDDGTINEEWFIEHKRMGFDSPIADIILALRGEQEEWSEQIEEMRLP